MAIVKIFFFILSIILVFVNSTVSSQVLVNKSFTLNSLENIPVKVNIDIDHVNDKITLMLSPSETLCMSGYSGLVEDIKIINKNFISLVYYLRGGSEVELARTVLVCVVRNKIYKAMDLVSMQSSYSKDMYDKEADSLEIYDESEIYKINFIPSQNSERCNYKLIATEYDKVSSKQDSTTNHETLDTLNFEFDLKNKVFYTNFILLNGNYIFGEDSNKHKQIKKTNYPAIKLKKEEYIFIDGTWYCKVHENHLLETSLKCN